MTMFTTFLNPLRLIQYTHLNNNKMSKTIRYSDSQNSQPTNAEIKTKRKSKLSNNKRNRVDSQKFIDDERQNFIDDQFNGLFED